MSEARSRHTPALVLAVLALMVVGMTAEIALRLLAPVVNPYEEIERLRPQINQYIRFEYPRNYAAMTEVEPGLPGLSGSHSFTTNNMGFRGDSLADPRPPREFRIFMVGGSTTECFYLDDEQDMARIVQRELSAAAPAGSVIRVYNAGLSGAASDDHVATISQRIIHLQPDLLVVFSGINDLLRSIYNYDYRHYVEYHPAYHKPWYKRWPMKLQITRRLFLLKQRFKADSRQLQEQRPLKSNYAALVELQRSVPESDAVPRVDEASYATNLRSIVGIARANHVRIVFMTQQTTWNSRVDHEARNRHWMRYRAGAPGVAGAGITFREDVMDTAMERLNDAMRTVAAEDSVPLYDLARLLPKSLEYFYDDCHFNVEGASVTARGLSQFIVDRGLLSPPGTGAITEIPTK